jgi:hypothetical protein
MSSLLVPLFSLRNFSFSTLTASTSLEIVLVRALDVLEAREASLLVRVHARTIDSGSSIAISLRAVAPSQEEPGTDFPDDTSPLATVTISAGTTVTLGMASVTSGMPAWGRVVIKGTRGSSGSCQADLAADLVLKG